MDFPFYLFSAIEGKSATYYTIISECAQVMGLDDEHGQGAMQVANLDGRTRALEGGMSRVEAPFQVMLVAWIEPPATEK